LILAVLIAGGIFAQEKSANVKNNWISGELGIFGFGARYEYMLSPNLSIGANVYFNTLIILNDFGVTANLRYYPWGKTFYAELGLGYGYHMGFETIGKDENVTDIVDWLQTTGILITPGLGWKIDVGKPGGFYLYPGIKVPIVLGNQAPVISFADYEEKFGIGVGFLAYFGMGYAF
jgi:hypothetical protein